MSKEDISDIVKTLIEFKGEMNTALEHVQGEIELSRIETITEVQRLEIKLSDSISQNTKEIAVVSKGQTSQGREIRDMKNKCERIQTGKFKRVSVPPAKKVSFKERVDSYGALIIGIITTVGLVVAAFFKFKN